MSILTLKPYVSDIISFVFYFLVIVPSSIIHEYAHGLVADELGDATARYAGRLTLDPRKHIDLFGTILMPIGLLLLSGGQFMFAYAKPVPYNPYNLKNQRWGPVMVGLAGPCANLLLAVAFAVVFRLFPTSPIAPFVGIIVYANVLLTIFNLLPVPPLDGSKLLYALLPQSTHAIKMFFNRYGLILVFILTFFFAQLLVPVIDWLTTLLLGVTF